MILDRLNNGGDIKNEYRLQCAQNKGKKNGDMLPMFADIYLKSA